MPRTCTAGSGMLSCFPVEIDEKVRRFVHSHSMQLCSLQFRRQTLPDRDSQVLSSRNAGEELRYLFVQETMVETLQHFPAHRLLQLLEVHDKAGTRIHFSFHRDLEHIIMPVPVR